MTPTPLALPTPPATPAPQAVIVLPDNGQQIPIDASLVATDAQVREVLRVVYPDLGNAGISRTTRNGQTVITVVKQAGSKGGTP